MKKIIKNLIKNQVPLNSYFYKLDLDQKKHIMQGNRYSKYYSKILNLNFNELCILFRSDKASMYENTIYNFIKKKYERSIIVGHNYGKFYEKFNKKNIKNIIEIGSFLGSSSAVFKIFFPKSKVFCLDITYKQNLVSSKNIIKSLVDQSKKNLLEEFIKKKKLFKKIDLVSDDAAHQDKHILASFDVLFPNLKKGGKYFIEDVTKKFQPRTYEIFIKNKTKILPDIKSIKYFKSDISPKTQTKSQQCYIIVIEKG